MAQAFTEEKKKRDVNRGYGIMGNVYGDGAVKNVQPQRSFVPKIETAQKTAGPKPYNLYDPNGPEVKIQEKMGKAAGILTGHSPFLDKRAADTIQALKNFPAPPSIGMGEFSKLRDTNIATRGKSSSAESNRKMTPTQYTNDVDMDSFKMKPPNLVMPDKQSKQVAVAGEMAAQPTEPVDLSPKAVWDEKRRSNPLHDAAIAKKQDKEQLLRATNVHPPRQFAAPAENKEAVAGTVQDMGLKAGPTPGEGGEFSFRPPATGYPPVHRTEPPVENTSGQAIAATVPQEPEMIAGHAPTTVNDQVAPTIQATKQGNILPEIQGNRKFQVNLSDQDKAIKDSIAAIDARIASGVQPTPEQAARIQEIKRRAGFMRGGTDRVPVGPDGLPLQKMVPGAAQRVGNMDVQFDQSVSPEAQRRFNAIPIQGKQPTWADEHKQWESRQPQQRVMQSPQSLGLLTKENSPGMGWKQRAKLNEQILANQQSDKNNALANSTAQERNRIDALANQQSDKNNALANSTAQERNRIDAMNVSGQNQERQSRIAANQFALNQAQIVANLRNQMAEAPDDATRNSIAKRLSAYQDAKEKGKVQIEKRTVTNDLGEKVEELYRVNESGDLVPAQIVGGGAAQIDLPRDVSQRQAGKIYMTAKGPALWDGKGLILQQ